MKTREGDLVPLKDVLDEAVYRARAIIEEKNSDLEDDDKVAIAEIVGVGSVK